MQEVIVQNKRTGHKKTMTVVMARNLSSKYSIVNSDTEFKPPTEQKSELEALRQQYSNKFGQQPHHRLGIERLKQLITE